MKTIWKYPLSSGRVNLVDVPQGAQLLHVAMQAKVPGSAPIGETPTLWYLVDPAEPKERKTIVIIGTGDQLHAPADNPPVHLGSVLTSDGGGYVWHIFENKAAGG